MIYQAKISKKGTITIPADIRKALALKSGQKVLQSMEGNKIVLDFGIEPTTSTPQEGKRRKK